MRVEVGDAAEAELLARELAAEPIRHEGAYLYFYGTAELTGKLRELGYAPQLVNPYELFRRVVSIARVGDEAALQRFGVQVINREPKAWVVEAPLANLRALAHAGYRIGEVGPNQPRLREIRVQLKSPEDAQAISELDIDIFNVSMERKSYVLTGAAFDYQIDALQERGYVVERMDSRNQETP